MTQITFADMVTKTVNMINEKPARIKPYQKMYSGLDQIKESISNAISQIEPEERARLMRLNEAPDKPDDIICPHCDYKLDDEEADQVCDEGCPSCRRRFEIN
jgi:rubrerythrin